MATTTLVSEVKLDHADLLIRVQRELAKHTLVNDSKGDLCLCGLRNPNMAAHLAESAVDVLVPVVIREAVNLLDEHADDIHPESAFGEGRIQGFTQASRLVDNLARRL